MKTKSLYLLALSLLLFSKNTDAQVTIGSGLQPSTGVLLDLKERNSITSNNSNSDRGLGLPRVSMLTTTPTTGELAKSIGGGNEVWDEEAHTGLLVYNINPPTLDLPTCTTTGAPLGLYVWNGNKWQSLSTNTENTVTGKSGMVYNTQVFGDAGEWMVENLRETSYDVGETGTIIEKIATGSDNNVRAYYYPANKVDNPHTGVASHDRQLFDVHPQYGLLYTWTAASNGKQTDAIAENTAGALSSTVQGICPKGWRLPSDKDWSELEKEIADHPELYSGNPAGSTPWQGSSWTSITGWRPATGANGYGKSMKSCEMVDGITTATAGLSTNKGFNSLLSGYIMNGTSDAYGIGSNMWSSSTFATSSAWTRYLSSGFSGVYRSNYSNTYMFSVRCKK